MQSFLVSTGVVALAEIGDKTQLLALVLASRFRKPFPIIAGILLATLANHFLAGALGAWVSGLVPENVLRWALGVSFLGFAVWALIPDKLSEEDDKHLRFGAFLTTLVVFFLVEIGDKTQVATIALAAQYQDLMWVVLGTTLGMLIANVPVVLLGNASAQRIPLHLVRYLAAVTFAALGIWALVSG